MNKSLLTHAVWLVVAAGAFAGGLAIKGGDDDATTDSGGNSASGLPSALDKAGAAAAAKNSPEAAGAAGGAAGTAFAANPANSKALLSEFLASNDPLEQNYLFAQMLLGLTPENAAELYEQLQGKLTGRDGGRQMNLFFQAWGKIDGAAAIAAASADGLDMRGGPGRGGGFNVGAVLAGWAGSDPEAAKTWLGEVEDERQKGFLTFGLINGLALSDPDAATDYVLELAAMQGDDAPQTPWGGNFTDRYVDMIAEEQLKRGVTSATAWAEGLPEGSMRASAFDEIAENLSRTDLEGAKDWIAQFAGSEDAGRAVREVAEQIARENPQDAIAWADDLPESAQAGVYSEALGRWTRDDAEGASEFLASMDNGDQRDAAVQSFANALVFERDDELRDPVSAAAWAVTITDQDARTETVTNVARVWMRSDAEAATAWLPDSGLTAEQQTEIIENPRGGRDGGFDRRRGGR